MVGVQSLTSSWESEVGEIIREQRLPRTPAWEISVLCIFFIWAIEYKCLRITTVNNQNRLDRSCLFNSVVCVSTDDPVWASNGRWNSRITAIRKRPMKKRTKNASTEGKIAVMENRTFPRGPREIPELGKLISMDLMYENSWMKWKR